MKNLHLLFALLILNSSLICYGQSAFIPKEGYRPEPVRTCATPELSVEFETWLQSLPAPSGSRAVYTLPVIIHVIHNGEAIGVGNNISLAQLNSQITIINEDFRKLNADISNLPGVWTNTAADSEINFCPAIIDPLGNTLAVPGINRVNRNTAGFTAPPYTANYTTNTIKPATIWDPEQYLNIWCVPLSGGLLGYATFPSGSGLPGLTGSFGTATTDGIVVRTTAFGNTGSAAAPFDKGRTATHELGHWLGLRHIWGDGACATDYCADTPTQQTSNTGCPNFPSVTCSNGPNGDMHMNYMDYTNDACMYMFSNDQKTRMQTVMSNSPMRVALATSIKCAATLTLDAGISSIVSPSGSSCITTITPQVTLNNYGSATLTSVNISYSVDGGASSIFNWTGSLASGANVNVILPNVTTTVGAHTFEASTSSPNGGTDQNNANNASIGNFNIINPPTGVALPFVQGFQGATFVPAGWALINPEANNTWARVTTAGGFGNSTASARMDNFSGNVNIAGQSDFLISPALNFSSANIPLNMDFNVAYAQYNATYTDSLIVSISTDCGGSWVRLFAKGRANLATAPDQTTAFVPTATQWRAETINLNTYIGQSSVQVRFEGKSGWGNHLYLDDINLYFPSTPAPVAGFSATPLNVCVGQSVAYTDTSSNSPTSWSWTFPGGTPGTSTVQNPVVVYNTAGSYNATLTVTNSSGSNTASKTNYITVNPSVVPYVSIAASPAGSICTGTSVTFTATPTNGGTTPVYQWKLNGANVGSNSPTYTNAGLANGNIITCEMTSNANCASPATVTSNSITMTVTPSVTPTVSIAASPSGAICAGTSVTFTATPTNGGTTPVYQWKLNGANVGSNSATYTNAGLANGNIITCEMISNANCASPGTVTSNSITMTVTPSVTPSVSIVASPSGSICAGTSVTFTANPTNGGAAPVYQWKLNGANVGSNSATYTNAGLANGNIITCEMTSSVNCSNPATVTSNSITMTVTPSVAPSVSIVASPSGAICAGTSVTFTATPTSGGAAPFYQWKLNGSNVGTNSTTYTNASLTNGAVITCELTSNAACANPATVVSNAITITLSSTLVPSVSIAASPSGAICAGTSVTFTATPTNGGATPQYQWKLNGANVGTNSVTYTNSNLINGNAISCEMTSSYSCASPTTATSNTITMTVNPNVAPSLSIVASPSGTICSGTNVTFTATQTNGGTTPQYQWKLNGANVGTNLSTYSNSSLVNGDVVACEMTSSAMCSNPSTVTSNALTITVNPSVVPSVSIVASPTGAVCSGTSVTFTATPTNGGASPIYQWKLNGVNVGTTSNSYANSSLVNGDVIAVEMTSSAACTNPATITSNSITMSILTSPVPNVNIVASTIGAICSGTTVNFTATATNGGASPAYQWQLNGANVGTNSNIYVNNALVNGDVITCVMTSGLSCASPTTANSNSITMTVDPVVVPSINIIATPSGAICAGTTVNFTATPTNGGSAPVYQWKLNGNNVGTNSPNYANSSLANGSAITCEMTSNANCANPGTVSSNAITITVSPNIVPAVSIVASPSGVICAGTLVTFNATPFNGGTNPVYQWKLNGVNVGFNSAVYTTSTLVNGDVITCEMTSNANCASPATVSSNAIVMNTSQISLTTNTTNISCFNAGDGSATVNVNGGTAPYTYLWSDGASQTTATASALAAGNYSVTITDDNGCNQTAIITLIQPSAINLSVASTIANCGENNGTATVSASGGTGPYNYLWNDTVGQSTPTANSLAAGIYSVTVTDANNCTQTAGTQVNAANTMELTVDITQVSCFQGKDGTATVRVDGANGISAPYNYLWNDAELQSTPKAINLESGEYKIIVTDSDGCSQSVSVIVNEPSKLVNAITSTNTTCGKNNGAILIKTSGGTAPYTHQW
ncbi:MAG: PKD domain-containing protein, partial [Bacteroidota bacterium]|nr:PKD domain-containing protein [Bacteroidota bacterium]